MLFTGSKVISNQPGYGSLADDVIDEGLFAPVIARVQTSIGASSMAKIPDSDTTNPVISPAITTQTKGSTFIAILGGYTSNNGTPTDNYRNGYVQIAQQYYAPFGTTYENRIFACVNGNGGINHQLTFIKNGVISGEVDLALIEIKNSSIPPVVVGNYQVAGSALISGSITTQGAATLIAIWFGDSGDQIHTAVPNNSFSVIQSYLSLPSSLGVQCAIATKEVNAAGTYNVEWTETPDQGACLYLISVPSSITSDGSVAATVTIQLAGVTTVISGSSSVSGSQSGLLSGVSTSVQSSSGNSGQATNSLSGISLSSSASSGFSNVSGLANFNLYGVTTSSQSNIFTVGQSTYLLSGAGLSATTLGLSIAQLANQLSGVSTSSQVSYVQNGQISKTLNGVSISVIGAPSTIGQVSGSLSGVNLSSSIGSGGASFSASIILIGVNLSASISAVSSAQTLNQLRGTITSSVVNTLNSVNGFIALYGISSVIQTQNSYSANSNNALTGAYSESISQPHVSGSSNYTLYGPTTSVNVSVVIKLNGDKILEGVTTGSVITTSPAPSSLYERKFVVPMNSRSFTTPRR